MSALVLALMLAAPQTHDMGGMAMPGMGPGMAMPARKAAAKTAARKPVVRKAAPRTSAAKAAPKAAAPKAAAIPGMAMPASGGCSPEHAAMGHCKAAGAAVPMEAMPDMPGMAMPAPASPAPSCAPEHAAMGHCKAAVPMVEPMPGMAVPAGTDLPAGDAPAPAPPTTLAAARFYDPAAMARANRAMRDEHGGMRFHQILFNLAEVQVRDGRDGYRWDGEGWFGGDIDRFVVKSEGEGGLGDRVEAAEVQALYSRALDPYWNLQAGVRQDLARGSRTWATVGVEGLAPYWFDVEGAVFVSGRGDVLARAEGWYDQRITQRAILQPRVELNLAAQDVRASGIGAGLSSAEVGVRLRYEIAREFAPYVGVSWERRYGATARFARAVGGGADGGGTGGFALALGLRGWF